ncbi:MAG: hypothetical protein ACOY3P_01360 [Planctomycetota bacterium]
MTEKTRWFLIIVANIMLYGVLGFFQNAEAQRTQSPQAPQLPFANSVEQRIEMVQELREIRDLLKEQNTLLRSGSLRVVVTLPDQR